MADATHAGHVLLAALACQSWATCGSFLDSTRTLGIASVAITISTVVSSYFPCSYLSLCVTRTPAQKCIPGHLRKHGCPPWWRVLFARRLCNGRLCAQHHQRPCASSRRLQSWRCETLLQKTGRVSSLTVSIDSLSSFPSSPRPFPLI